MTGPEPASQAHLANLIEQAYPLQRHLGFELTDWQIDYCQITLPLAPYLMNHYGVPHGRVHATLLDTVMGFCGCYTGDRTRRQLAMTLSLIVNFLGQSKVRTLIAKGRRAGGGRKTFFATATVLNDTGAQIASGISVFRYPTPPDLSA
ncbi:MAG: PaaI family thioesterase [Paracoccaceae bacterium]|nr:PaaI family thioesterase [Paracoccaceae bacterium]